MEQFLLTIHKTKGSIMDDGKDHDWIKLVGQTVEVWKKAEGYSVRPASGAPLWVS